MKVADLKFCYTTALNFKLVQVGANNVMSTQHFVPQSLVDFTCTLLFFLFSSKICFTLCHESKTNFKDIESSSALSKSIGPCKLFKFDQEQKQGEPDFCLNISTICAITSFVCNMKGICMTVKFTRFYLCSNETYTYRVLFLFCNL